MADIVGEKDVTFSHPFRIMCAGASGTGKTTFVRKFLTNLHHVVKGEFNNIVFSYAQEQPLYDEIRLENPGINWVEGFNMGVEKEFLSDISSNDLIIFDDQMDSLCNDLNFETFFTKKSHHMNISVIFLTQNIYYKSKCMRTINLNTTCYIIFKSPRDMSQIYTLSRQLFPGMTKYLVDSYKDIVKSPFGYMVIDIDPRTFDNLRVRTNIFPEETMTIYQNV